ncbi:uncharacterized protein LOC115663090 [Syzygium oleosum]|uniref:uncharacterized protein LOC115663090 n=1 Tax=Syzygium oleosum TaxID=219896 RepID=UPI0011D2C75A|nr:uncharacterized protein LOC115663090 [Syzygium oleosum]
MRAENALSWISRGLLIFEPLEEVIRNPSPGPSPVAESQPAVVGLANTQPAVDGPADTSKAAELKGKSTSFSHEVELPSGPRLFLKANSSCSRSRGCPKNRSRSLRRAHNAGPSIRSVPRPNTDGKTNVVGQNLSRPQGQPTPAPVTRTWANVAKVLTKGYNLAYVPPLVEDGEVIVDITLEVIADENPLLLECIVGHYIGKKISFKLTEEAIKKSWGDQVVDVKLHENGFYFFRVPNAEFRRKIIDMGPVSIFSSTLMLQQWHSKLKLKKGSLDTLPVWVRLRDIPFSLWSSVGIGRIASAIGKPLYVDVQTEQMTRISYARVCMEINATKSRVEAVKFRWDVDLNVPLHILNIELSLLFDLKEEMAGLTSLGKKSKNLLASRSTSLNLRLIPQLAPNLGEDEPLPPVLNTGVEPGLMGTDLNYSKVFEAEPSHSTALCPAGLTDQQSEDPSQNSQSSSEDSLDSRTIMENNSDSEVMAEMEPAVLKLLNMQTSCLITIVYGEHTFVNRRSLWADVIRLSSCELPWIVAGDFNAIRDPDDRVGSTTPWIPAFDEFGDCLNQAGLEDLRYVGWRYTWTYSSGDNRKLRKIDRVLINDLWNQLFSFSEATFLAPGISDHSPMVIKIFPPLSSNKPFKFFNFWATHPKFLDLVAQAWDTHIVGTPMYMICCKLRVLKAKLKHLNRSSFSAISTRTEQARSDLYAIQVALEHHPFDQSLLDREVEYIRSFSALRLQEESFFRQKFRIRWLKERDMNTKFFHHFVNKRRLQNRILSVSADDGVLLTDPQAVRNHIVGHFQELLNGNSAYI